MKYIRLLLLAAFAGAIIGVVIQPKEASSAPRLYSMVTKTYTNDGDTITPFAISCASTTWTAISAADYRTRRITMQNLTGGQTVCLSSGTANSNTCNATSPSYKLISPSVYEYYSESAVYCRALDAQAAQVVHGIKYTDSGDSTTIQ